MTINIYLSENPYTMENITGYQYIDQPASELLDTLPSDVQINLKEIFKNIHSAGKAEGYSQGKGLDTQHLKDYDISNLSR
jgi:hypothetical protein